MLSDKIRALKLPRPLTVESGTSVGEVIQKIQRQGAGCVLVSKDSRLLGIMTERDVLMKVVARDVEYSEPVDTFMTPDPRTLTPDDTIGEAISLMNSEGFRNIPIINPSSGEAIAIFRSQDLIDYLAEAYPEKLLNLPPRPHQLLRTPEGA
ncbi:MAG TPA: CBS domain-containing protein [Dehalococcoidia bacterium]|nr:CBS domain-containing protein [Dehalococcoidia bacterium]